MKRIWIFILFIFSCSEAQAQDQYSNPYELKDIVFDKGKIWKLLSDRSEPYKLELRPLVEHPFYYNLNNKKISIDSVKFTFLGLPVEDIYAYTFDKDKFSIYLTDFLDLAANERVFNLIGKSENFFDEDPTPLSEYDIFSWSKPDLKIMISKGMFGQYRNLIFFEIRSTTKSGEEPDNDN